MTWRGTKDVSSRIAAGMLTLHRRITTSIGASLGMRSAARPRIPSVRLDNEFERGTINSEAPLRPGGEYPEFMFVRKGEARAEALRDLRVDIRRKERHDRFA